MGKPEVHEVPSDGDTGAARAVNHTVHVGEPFPDDLQRVHQCRGDDDRRTVLVVMEHGNVTDLREALLHLKATRRGDVLEVNAAERTGEEVDCPHQFINILRLDTERESVHVGKGLEERALPFHDGHPRLGTDIPEPEDRRAVGDDCHEIFAARQGIGFIGVVPYFQARLCHTGGIGERKILARSDRAPGDDLNLPFPFIMLF